MLDFQVNNFENKWGTYRHKDTNQGFITRRVDRISSITIG